MCTGGGESDFLVCLTMLLWEDDGECGFVKVVEWRGRGVNEMNIPDQQIIYYAVELRLSGAQSIGLPLSGLT